VKRIAINYKENDAAAEDAARLLKSAVRTSGDQGGYRQVADIQRMFETIKSQFGGLDIFVSNARATLAQASTRNQWRSRWRHGRRRLTPRRRVPVAVRAAVR